MALFSAIDFCALRQREAQQLIHSLPQLQAEDDNALQDTFWADASYQLLMRQHFSCLAGSMQLWGVKAPAMLHWMVDADALTKQHKAGRSMWSPEIVALNGRELSLYIQYDSAGGAPLRCLSALQHCWTHFCGTSNGYSLGCIVHLAGKIKSKLGSLLFE